MAMKGTKHPRARPRARPQERGLTLIEILVVLVILSVLAALVTPSMMSFKTKNRVLTMAISALGKPTAGTALSPPWAGAHDDHEAAYQKLRNRLHGAGFGDQMYGLYIIPALEATAAGGVYDGFMLITAPERIDARGAYGADRFELERKVNPGQGLFERIQWLLQSAPPEGRFRFFVIALTEQPRIQNEKPPEWAKSSRWYSDAGSYASLPEEIGTNHVGQARLHVYVYTFERQRLERNPHATSEEQQPLNLHLQQAGLATLLNP